MFFKNQPTMRLICVFACVAVIATIAATGGAVAQDGPGITINDSNVTTDEQTTYAQEIDEDTRLVDWEYDEDREGFILVFETDSRTTMTLTEAVQFAEGAGSGRIYQKRLPAGMTEIFVSVPLRAGQAAVTMTTPGSIANNRFSYVSTGQTTPDRPPISYERAQIVILFSGIGGAGLTYRVVRKRREDEDKDVEQII